MKLDTMHPDTEALLLPRLSSRTARILSRSQVLAALPQPLMRRAEHHVDDLLRQAVPTVWSLGHMAPKSCVARAGVSTEETKAKLTQTMRVLLTVVSRPRARELRCFLSVCSPASRQFLRCSKERKLAQKMIHRIHVYSSPRARPHTRLAGLS